jgi:ABC-2 type transport system ATP-binding protein
MSAILECKSLTKKFSNLTALNNVNLSLERGRIIGLLGPNGSGKTTLIKLINGLLVPNEGHILIDGKVPSPDTKKIVSYLPEKTYLPDWMKISETIEFFKDFYSDFDQKRCYDMLDRLHLDPSRRLKSLSKGTKEKVQLILVMSRQADMFFQAGKIRFSWFPDLAFCHQSGFPLN